MFDNMNAKHEIKHIDPKPMQKNSSTIAAFVIFLYHYQITKVAETIPSA